MGRGAADQHRGSGRAPQVRIRFTIAWLRSETQGLAETTSIAESPPREPLRGQDRGDARRPADLRRDQAALPVFAAGASTATRIGLSR